MGGGNSRERNRGSDDYTFVSATPGQSGTVYYYNSDGELVPGDFGSAGDSGGAAMSGNDNPATYVADPAAAEAARTPGWMDLEASTQSANPEADAQAAQELLDLLPPAGSSGGSIDGQAAADAGAGAAIAEAVAQQQAAGGQTRPGMFYVPSRSILRMSQNSIP